MELQARPSLARTILLFVLAFIVLFVAYALVFAAFEKRHDGVPASASSASVTFDQSTTAGGRQVLIPRY